MRTHLKKGRDACQLIHYLLYQLLNTITYTFALIQVTPFPLNQIDQPSQGYKVSRVLSAGNVFWEYTVFLYLIIGKIP